MSSEHPLKYLISPRSIAVVGASQNFDSISGKPLRYLKQHGYRGALYPVNPRYDQVEGFLSYESVSSIKKPIDLVILVVAAHRVLDILRECVECGVKFALVISSGFAEASDTGRRLQHEISALCEQSGLRVIGPNTQGYFNLYDCVAATFSPALDLDEPIRGGLGFVSQSGAFGFSTYCLGQEAHMGFSHVLTTGNEADLDWMDVADYLVHDERTHTIAIYAEGLKSGSRLRQLASRALAAKKPIIVLKVGRTRQGSQAAASHTAALTGSDAIFDAACRQYGLTRVRDVMDIFDFAVAFRSRKYALGSRIGIVTTSGGAGVLAADEAVELGLELGDLTDETRATIQGFIPDFGSTQNPVDVTAEVLRRPETFRKTLNRVLWDKNVDQLVVAITMVTGKRAAERAHDIIEVCSRSDKPVVVSWSVSASMVDSAFNDLEAARIPVFPTPVRAVRALKAVADFSHHVRMRSSAKEAKGHSKRHVDQTLIGAGKLNEFDAKRLLNAYGIRGVDEYMVQTPDAAVEAAEALGYPVAVKAVSADLIHKSRMGGVELGIQTPDAVATAIGEIEMRIKAKDQSVNLEGFLVQKMIHNAAELILGFTRDPVFGPTIMLGLGGIFVEVMHDVTYRIPPINRAEAHAMIAELRGADILKGTDGAQPKDEESLVDAICNLARLALECHEDIRELEINPLMILPKGEGVIAADAVVIKQ